MTFGIGQPVRRVEDQRFVSGSGLFLDDIILPRQAYGVVVYSPYAFARLLRVDDSQARQAEGVLCVLSGADVLRERLGCLPPILDPKEIGAEQSNCVPRPVLATDCVRCVGDRVAFVVAETEAQARSAAELLDIEYVSLPPVMTLESAVGADAANIWSEAPGNVAFTIRYGDEKRTNDAFARAKHVVELRLLNNRVSANPIEPRAAIGTYSAADETYVIHTTSQNPHGLRRQLAGSVFGISDSQIRVVVPDVGGGFGMKADPHPKVCGRPVKWTASRSDSLMGDNHGRDQIVDGAMALDERGRILGIRARALHAVGAYVVSATVAPVNIAMRLIPSVYDIPTVDLVTRAIYTNTSPVGVYRGAGRPEAIYLIERLIERAATVIGIDPAEIRKRNLIPKTAMPYRTATGLIYDTGEFQELMEDCLARADWKGFSKRRTQSEKRGKLRGRAVTPYIEQGGVFNDRMELRFDPGGAVTIVAGTLSHGQGHATAYAQLVAEWLGIPFQKIRLLQGDTHQVPIGRGTYAARSSFVAVTALRSATDKVIERGKEMAAHLMETALEDIAFTDGRFVVIGTDRKLSLPDVVQAFYKSSRLAPEFGVGLDVAGFHSSDEHNFPNGCHVCEVEIDPDTGSLEIVDYCAVDDVGYAINPMICEGQIHGGLVQGIGQATLESIVYDNSGQLVTGSFSDYAMPRAGHVPYFKHSFRNVPSTSNPLGIKGVGESGTIAPPPAIVNAALDALRPLGVLHLDMPLTSARIYDAIQLALPTGL
jgi:carbon-monoxide dehydrogenase large subunit